jgi:hypothetical protein
MKAATNGMFPNSLYVQKPIFNTATAGVFTFIGAAPTLADFTPQTVTIALTNLNGYTLTRTYKPFAMKITTTTEQMVWPSVNLYAGSTAAISFTDNFGNAVACTNTVATVNLVPRSNAPGADFPAFSGGLWTIEGTACPGCSKTDWGSNAAINAQNIFLHPDFAP